MKYDDWHIAEYKEVKSTNDIALGMADTIENGCYVIKAEKQTNGRGRRGRTWESLTGNLFFSMLFKFDISKAGELAVICSLSLLQVIKKLDVLANVKLKWPNDVLLNSAKVSGILLEKAAGDYIVAGIGVNIAQSPKNAEMLYPVTSLKEAGIDTNADDFLKLYLEVFTDNFNLNAGDKFGLLRKLWSDNAKGLNERVIVRQNGKDIDGIFRGIDESGALLSEKDGKVNRILAGDVFFEEKENDGI